MLLQKLERYGFRNESRNLIASYLSNRKRYVDVGDSRSESALSHFADNPFTLGLELNFYLYKIVDWCNFNKLTLNASKSKWIYFSNKNQNIPRLFVNNIELERVKSYKYLGFNIDKRLHHNVHLRLLCGKLSSFSYITRKIKSFLTIDAARTIYFSLINSYVCYGLVVYGGALLRGTHSAKVTRLQN